MNPQATTSIAKDPLDTVIKNTPNLPAQVLEVKQQVKEVKYPHTVARKFTLKYNIQSILPKEIIDGITQTYSPGFVQGTSAVNKGITWEEQLKYMPTILGIGASANEFMSEVDDWFYNFTVEIPFSGREVDGSYTMIAPEIKLPVVIEDYILLAMLQADTNCSKDMENDAYGIMPYILEDLQVNKDNERKAFTLELEANRVLDKLNNDVDEVKLRSIAMHYIVPQALSITQIYNASKLDLLMIVRKAALAKPKEVIDLFNEEYLKVYSDIEEGIAIGVITLDGEAYYYKTHKLGTNKAHVATVLKTESLIYEGLQNAIQLNRKQLTV
jgi:hypothetical protein